MDNDNNMKLLARPTNPEQAVKRKPHFRACHRN